jgi:hypothetical protein
VLLYVCCFVICSGLTCAITEQVLSLTARVKVTDLGARTMCVRRSCCGTVATTCRVVTPIDTEQTVRSGVDGSDCVHRRLALVHVLFGKCLPALLGYVAHLVVVDPCVWPGQL